MKKQMVFFLILITCITAFCLKPVPDKCLAQGEWPPYTQNVLFDPIIQYIQAATLPGSIIVSGCWGYPWFTIPGQYSFPSTGWSKKNYYMYYPPIGWFDYYLYPFEHIYNVADPYRDFPNFSVLTNNPGTWINLPVDTLLSCRDPLCFYLAGGIHFFSGAVQTPLMVLMKNNPSIDPRLLRYLGLMGLFDYDIPTRLVSLPISSGL